MENENWEGIKFKDTMEARVFDKYGVLKQLHIDEDLVTSAGKAATAALILTDVVASGFDFIAIGSGTTAAAAGDVGLAKEFKRAAGVGTRVTTTVTNDTAQLVYTFASGTPSGLGGASTGSQAIAESAVFNSPIKGQLQCLARQTFNVLNINWAGGDSLQITWRLQVT